MKLSKANIDAAIQAAENYPAGYASYWGVTIEDDIILPLSSLVDYQHAVRNEENVFPWPAVASALVEGTVDQLVFDTDNPTDPMEHLRAIEKLLEEHNDTENKRFYLNLLDTNPEQVVELLSRC